MSSLDCHASLDRIRPLIERIVSRSGAPGLAVGVLQGRSIVHESYHGHRDRERELPVNRDTLFYVASLTKSITAAALGILVDQGLLEWKTPVHEILPELSSTTESFHAKLNVMDLLSHGTGKAWADTLYLQSNNRVLLPKEECIRVFDSLSQVDPVRSRYRYNNHAYNIAGLVIERVSGMNWGNFVQEQIFSPLGMSRTRTVHPSDDDNVAAPYNILTDGTSSRLPFCDASHDTMMFTGQSAIEPLLLPSKRPLPADREHGNMLRNPLKQIAAIIQPQRPRPVDSILEQTYALGWNRTQLPGSLDFGWNQELLLGRDGDGFFPALGEGYPGRLALWHGGNMPGTTAALCLLPETGTAVVVLQNSLGLYDAADWVCQAVVDTVFLGAPARDYLTLVSRCCDGGVERVDRVERQLQRGRIPGTRPSRPMTEYTGRYFNRLGNWFIEVLLPARIEESSSVRFRFRGLEDEEYPLRHYHHDVFVWNQSYDELVSRGQYIRDEHYYKIEFVWVEEQGKISLGWWHDKSTLEAEIFSRM